MSNYNIKSLEEYFHVYRKSVQDPRAFWDEVAEEHFLWRKKWQSVLSWDFSKPEIRWFDGAQLNITENCIDRHLHSRADKTAILFEPNEPGEECQHISYRELHRRVCKVANVLKAKGVQKGDRVCIYLPMIPELAVCALACARIGAVHSVVFAGFSASALATRIADCGAKMVLTSDGAYRGPKRLDIKSIVDEALEKCSGVRTVLLVRRTGAQINWQPGRDEWLAPLADVASADCPPVITEAEDALFILYTSGSTGKPKGMLHTCAGYMVYTAYTFQNVFKCTEGDTYWCTADIGWITGHSYILYGPLANGATTVMYEGVPSYPDYARFWDIIAKHNISHFYTAPTAIRTLVKQGTEYTQRDLSSLKVLGTVGEPINEEAWHWYNDNVGKDQCPIVDTWWQTETGGFMISPIPFVTPLKPTYATLPLPGVRPVLMSQEGEQMEGNQVQGALCIDFPWPAIARTIWGDHQRYRQTYFSTFAGKYFTGDGAIRDDVGYYRITGRLDDVIIVSGHNLGTAPIEDAINEHPAVAESAVVGYPHEIKGNALYGFAILKDVGECRNREDLALEINQQISEHIGPIAKLDQIQFVPGLPKTRSGKIMRRILRKIVLKDTENMGDISTLLNPEVVEEIIAGAL